MKVFTTKSQLKTYLDRHRRKGHSIGFVPTMGALHQGHLSLIEFSKAECDVTVCSIFVNPTQFNDPEDFKKYPRTIEQDSNLLREVDCEVLFLPSVDEMYRDFVPIHPDLQGIDSVLEGSFRPGHFDGVVQVVYLLLQAVQPTYIFMGLKDYQQQLIVKKMMDSMNLNTTLRALPIMREDSGLAMSSRNVRLSPEQRHDAAAIYKTLFLSAQSVKKGVDIISVLEDTSLEFKKYECRLEYMSICNAETLEPIEQYNPDIPTIILIAVWWGEVRLIDNIIIG